MGGLVGLPFRPRRLERAAGTPRDPGLLALLGTRLGPFLRCRRRRRIPTGDAIVAAIAVVFALICFCLAYAFKHCGSSSGKASIARAHS